MCLSLNSSRSINPFLIPQIYRVRCQFQIIGHSGAFSSVPMGIDFFPWQTCHLWILPIKFLEGSPFVSSVSETLIKGSIVIPFLVLLLPEKGCVGDNFLRFCKSGSSLSVPSSLIGHLAVSNFCRLEIILLKEFDGFALITSGFQWPIGKFEPIWFSPFFSVLQFFSFCGNFTLFSPHF